MRALALAAIRGYQRWISPHKGFCCALRAITGGDSCSAYGYQMIARFGLRRGLGLLSRRLELCGHVHGRAAPAPAPATAMPALRNPWRHKEQGFCDVPCDSPGCDSPGCDLPDLPCHAGHGSPVGRVCALGDNLLDLASCGCDIADCGRSGRRRAERWGYDCCGLRARRRRDSTHLDALARRIEERKNRPPAPE
jgi:putative component of membrane protein insertase Oxa1/YidC/SpoIIIJ protein YidD